LSRDLTRLLLIFAPTIPGPAFQVERPNRVRNADLLTFQFVPNICTNGVIHLVDRGMIAHVEFDLIDDGVIGEIDEKDSWRRISKHELSVFGCAHERILNAIRRCLIVDANANSHRVDLSGVMQIDDGFPDDFVVWNVEVNAVVCA
jgi:hypothetical protein